MKTFRIPSQQGWLAIGSRRALAQSPRPRGGTRIDVSLASPTRRLPEGRRHLIEVLERFTLLSFQRPRHPAANHKKSLRLAPGASWLLRTYADLTKRLLCRRLTVSMVGRFCGLCMIPRAARVSRTQLPGRQGRREEREARRSAPTARAWCLPPTLSGFGTPRCPVCPQPALARIRPGRGGKQQRSAGLAFAVHAASNPRRRDGSATRALQSPGEAARSASSPPERAHR